MGTEAIIILITAIAAVLQIILFFKVWAMTNDVRKICGKYTISGDVDSYEIRKYLLLGDKERVLQLIYARFFSGIDSLRWSGDFSEQSFGRLKKALEEDLAKMNEKLPEKIAELKSLDDYNKIYREPN